MCSGSLKQKCSAWQNVKILYWAILCFFQMLYLQKQVHTSLSELCRTLFRVPTCCSWGKINVEQAEGRNAFKAPLIELDGLQSQRQSVSTRLGRARSWDVPHTYTSLNRLLWLTAPRYQWTLQRQWELYGKVVWKEPPSFLKMKVPWLSMKGKCSHAEAHWAGHWTGEHSSVIQFDLDPICRLRVTEYRAPHTGRRRKGRRKSWENRM